MGSATGQLLVAQDCSLLSISYGYGPTEDQRQRRSPRPKQRAGEVAGDEGRPAAEPRGGANPDEPEYGGVLPPGAMKDQGNHVLKDPQPSWGSYF